MSLPLATSLLVSGVTVPAVLVAVSVIAGFLSHEPLLLLLGHRGTRARREQGPRATAWFIATTATTLAAGLSALSLVPSDVRWSLLLPVVPVVPLAWLIARGQGKSAAAEIAAALAFSSCAIPICLTAGAPTRAGLAIATAFASIFVTATLAVRVVVLRVRGGGHPRATAATRMTALVLTTTITACLVVAAIYGWTPWVTGGAAAPGLAVAGWLALFPLSPTHLRMVGWTLVATSTTAAVILALAL